MNINMTDELKIVIPKPNIYTIDFSEKTLKEYNELLLKSREADGIVECNKDFNRCPVCGCHFVKGHNYCTKCGQRVRFVESDVVPL